MSCVDLTINWTNGTFMLAKEETAEVASTDCTTSSTKGTMHPARAEVTATHMSPFVMGLRCFLSSAEMRGSRGLKTFSKKRTLEVGASGRAEIGDHVADIFHPSAIHQKSLEA